jgi:hypothetical protein
MLKFHHNGKEISLAALTSNFRLIELNYIIQEKDGIIQNLDFFACQSHDCNGIDLCRLWKVWEVSLI